MTAKIIQVRARDEDVIIRVAQDIFGTEHVRLEVMSGVYVDDISEEEFEIGSELLRAEGLGLMRVACQSPN